MQRPPPAPAASCAQPLTPRAAFCRIFNLRTVAAVFYFCQAVVVGRLLTDLQYEDLGDWAMTALRFLRQNLISGLLLLATIAAADGIAGARGLGRRAALAVGVLLVLAGSALAVLLRVWVYGTLTTPGSDPAYLAGVWLTWACSARSATRCSTLCARTSSSGRRCATPTMPTTRWALSKPI